MAAITHTFPERFGPLIHLFSVTGLCLSTRFDTPNDTGSERFAARAKISRPLSFYFANGLRSCSIRVSCIDAIEQSRCLRDFPGFILGALRRPLSISMNHASPRSLHNFSSKIITRASNRRSGHPAHWNSRFCDITSMEYIQDWLDRKNGRLLVIAYVNYTNDLMRVLKKQSGTLLS
jgi:hypothetical protein